MSLRRRGQSAPVGLGMSAALTRSSLPFTRASPEAQTPRSVRAAMGCLSALRTVLLLGMVTGLAGCAPGLNGTADHWEALYSRSLARIQGEKREEMNRESDYLIGIKRLRRLYCNVGIGFHMQVLPDGRITGVHNENRYSKSVHDRALTLNSKRRVSDRNMFTVSAQLKRETRL